jgi:hypothetical protein
MDEENDIEPTSLPIFKKGREIDDLVRKITDLIPEDNDELQLIKAQMLADSAMLCVKVVGATTGRLFDIKMEAATLIRRAAHELMVSYHTLKMLGFKEAEYYLMVRSLIEEYRLLFIDWVAGFDKWNYVIDRWGLFNPPGVGPLDKDPDEDIPWDNPLDDDDL